MCVCVWVTPFSYGSTEYTREIKDMYGMLGLWASADLFEEEEKQKQNP